VQTTSVILIHLTERVVILCQHSFTWPRQSRNC